MSPLSSIFSRGNLNRPVSSIGNLSGDGKAVSSALRPRSDQVPHVQTYGASLHASTSIFHPNGYSQRGTTSITHVMNGDVVEQSSEGAMRDAVLDDARYRYARRKIRERQSQEQTREERFFGHFGIGKAAGVMKKFKKGLFHMVKSMPAAYKNLSVDDQKYFRDMVRRYAKSLPTGSGFDLKMRKKMKRELYADTKSFKVNRVDRKSFEHLIDQLPW